MVATIFLVPALVLTVVSVPAIVVPIAVMVPVMVVLDTPVLTVPVASEVTALFIVRNNPNRATIRRTSPVASVPRIMTVHRIPVAFDPHVLVILWVGAWRSSGDHSRCGRCDDLNSD